MLLHADNRATFPISHDYLCKMGYSPRGHPMLLHIVHPMREGLLYMEDR